MRSEREPKHETIRRGQLLMLTHPGTDIFSGYGLVVEDARPDHLVGILMVDRPHRADPAWLDRIASIFGEYQLVPVTQTGERGIVTQMRIAPESVQFLQLAPAALATAFTAALQPLLKRPPAPMLKLWWDAHHRLWRSEFWVGLPPALQEVFIMQGYGSLAVEAEGQTFFITHASSADIERFRGAPVLWHWELVEMPTAPLLRFRATVLDSLRSPYVFEHFLNIAEADQASCVSRLMEQPELFFDFFDDSFEYVFSKQVPNTKAMRQMLSDLVRQAIDHYGQIPPEQRDFDRAKAEFQRQHPI